MSWPSVGALFLGGLCGLLLLCCGCLCAAGLLGRGLGLVTLLCVLGNLGCLGRSLRLELGGLGCGIVLGRLVRCLGLGGLGRRVGIGSRGRLLGSLVRCLGLSGLGLSGLGLSGLGLSGLG